MLFDSQISMPLRMAETVALASDLRLAMLFAAVPIGSTWAVELVSELEHCWDLQNQVYVLAAADRSNIVEQ